MLLFVEEPVTREAAQEQFLAEADAWSAGHFRARYGTRDELKTEALRGWQIVATSCDKRRGHRDKIAESLLCEPSFDHLFGGVLEVRHRAG